MTSSRRASGPSAPSRAWLAAAAVFALATLGLARGARADEMSDERGPAASLITDAVAEYDAGHFEEARALFRKAQAGAPSARTLRGIGMASFELRDYVEATRALSGALRESRHVLTLDQRAHVEGLLARAESFVGRFTPRLQPPDATLTVDGKPAVREPDGALLLSFGRHVVVARCPSCAPAERELEVVGGERQPLDLALAPAAAGDATGGAGTGTGAGRAGSDAPGRDGPEASVGRHSPAAYWLGGAALLSTAGAIAGGLWWRDRASELDACRAAGDRCQNESTVATESNFAAGVTLGLAAAAVTTGIVAAILWSHREPPPAARALACTGTKGGVICAIRF